MLDRLSVAAGALHVLARCPAARALELRPPLRASNESLAEVWPPLHAGNESLADAAAYAAGFDWALDEGSDEGAGDALGDASILPQGLRDGKNYSWDKEALDAMLRQYPELHRSELAKKSKGRFVLVHPYHGLGNRLAFIVSSFALALVSGRALVIDWPRRGHGTTDPAGLDDLFVPRAGLKWNIPSFLNGEKGMYVHDGAAYSRLIHSAFDAKKRILSISSDQFYLHNVTCRRGRAGDHPNLFPGPLTSFGLLLDALMQPVPKVRDRIERTLAGARCLVGVHLRKGRAANASIEQVGRVLRERSAACAQGNQSGAGCQAASIFVSADYKPASQAAKQRIVELAESHGVPVLSVVGNNATRLTIDGVIDALVENTVLASCETLYPQPVTHSTFYMLAVARAILNKKLRTDEEIAPFRDGFALSYQWSDSLQACPPEGISA